MGLPPEYVLDNMQMYEIGGFLDYRHLRHKEEWEQTRWFGTLYANYHSKSRVYPERLIKFPWDSEHEEKSELTKKQREDMKGAKGEWETMLKEGETSAVTLKDIKKVEFTNGK